MYTIKEASARSGVGIPLLRAWERRYGVVSPMRTDAGYRLYDDAAIARLRAMRQLIANGWSAQQAAARIEESSEAEIGALAVSRIPAGDDALGSPSEVSHALEPSAAEDLISRLVGAARELDAASLESSLDEAFASGRFERVADRVLMPALRAIGDAWERGEVSVAGEHAASHAILRRLAMAYEAAGAAEAERPILVGLGPGSRHELGGLAFAVAARRAGLPILYLGPDLPADSWTAAAVGRRARAAVVGVATAADVARATQVIDAVRAAAPEVVLVVGGDKAERAAAVRDVLVLPPSLPDAVDAITRAIGRRGRSR